MGEVNRLRVGSGQVDPYFKLETFFFYYYKENNMYLLFEKSRTKLLDIKCNTLNSPLISRNSSAKQINTCSIILKLYKSKHY